jgi:hypothetical protein
MKIIAKSRSLEANAIAVVDAIPCHQSQAIAEKNRIFPGTPILIKARLRD